jgi:hypothetical protein
VALGLGREGGWYYFDPSGGAAGHLPRYVGWCCDADIQRPTGTVATGRIAVVASGVRRDMSGDGGSYAVILLCQQRVDAAVAIVRRGGLSLGALADVQDGRF